MNTQHMITNIYSLNLFDFNLHMDDQITKTNHFSATDIGYEINSEDLGNATTALIPCDLIDLSTPQVSPDEFDAIYQWVIS
jgi:hypothetical protein